MAERVNMTPVTLPRCASEWPDKVIRAARKALREEMRDQDVWGGIDRDINSDSVVEQVWNAIVKASGHDDLARS